MLTHFIVAVDKLLALYDEHALVTHDGVAEPFNGLIIASKLRGVW